MPSFPDCPPGTAFARQMFELVADVERYPEFVPRAAVCSC
jgi:ribosome-associated toxin RatA of RatAB toxin-antitoxin module